MSARVLLAVVCFWSVTFARAEDMPANQEAKILVRRLDRPIELRYLLFLPEGYKQEPQKRWPLMLFLHGSGERGTNLARVAVHGPPKIVKNRPDFPFILVSPQCPGGELWSDDAVLALLDEIQDKYRVDENRVYLTGLSMGGYGAWSLGMRYPDRFAAIVPICGGGSLLPIIVPAPGKESALKRLPVWAFHGAKDTVVPMEQSEALIQALKKLGNANTRLTIYPDAGHDAWTETYNNQELYDWLLQQTRARKSAKRMVRSTRSPS